MIRDKAAWEAQIAANRVRSDADFFAQRDTENRAFEEKRRRDLDNREREKRDQLEREREERVLFDRAVVECTNFLVGVPR
jgi:hypothetical protein